MLNFMKKWLFVLLFLVTSYLARTQTLHLLLVSDYADINFGMVSIADEEMVNQMFRKIASRIDYQFLTHYVNKTQPKGFTNEAVMDMLKTPTQPNDIFIFYFSGLGSYSNRRLYPNLNLDKSLSLDRVASVLQAKGLKLGLVLADCRNQFTDHFPIAGLGQRGTIVQDDQSKKITKKLFLENDCRVVKVASARRAADFLSYKNNSVFSYSLTETYEDFLYVANLEEVSLDNFIREIEATTKAFIPTYEGLRDESVKCKVRR